VSFENYELSKRLFLEVSDDNYYALIMAAMRGADVNNLGKLKREWPEVWEELYKRYNAPGGLLEGES
jgi:hypothetical protein